ncbi:MAG: hypothetical protein ABJN26_20315 [Stappiaceae bacterium]
MAVYPVLSDSLLPIIGIAHPGVTCAATVVDAFASTEQKNQAFSMHIQNENPHAVEFSPDLWELKPKKRIPDDLTSPGMPTICAFSVPPVRSTC